MHRRGFRLALTVSIAFASPLAGARGPRPSAAAHAGRRPAKAAKTPIDEFERMPPEQQQRALDRLPPGQRQKLQQRIDQFNQLPREQQQTLRNLYGRLHSLPPERQNAVRNAINRFSEQPPQRQQAMRAELRGLAALPEQDRQARIASREFKSQFNGKEQGILRDMSPLLASGN
jgi:hypothetical protein